MPRTRIDANGHTLTYEYDALRRLTRLTNENGEHWTFEYDAADNLIRETRFDGTTSHYRYDKAGQLIHQSDSPHTANQTPTNPLPTNQRHTYYERDLIGQLTVKHSIDHRSDATNNNEARSTRRHHKTKYHYDIKGQLIRATSVDASTQLEYDPAGQLIRETLQRHHGNHDQHIRQTLTHTYDDIGNRIATTLPDGKTLNQLYYGSGHLYNQSVVDEQGNITEIRHSERNELHQEIIRQQGRLTSAYAYDPMGRLTTQTSQLNQDHHTNHHIERHYAYDAIGQLTHLSGQTTLHTKRATHTPANKHPLTHYQRNHQYQYDNLGRLTQHKLTDYANHTGITEVFAFDPASNRVPVSTLDNNTTADSKPIHKSGRPTELNTHDSHITYTYDSQGRIQHKTKTPLGNDDKPLKQSDNAIVGYKESLQLFYNPNDELEKSITIHQQGITLTEVTTTYHYDAFGRRIAKSSQTKHKRRVSKDNQVIYDIAKMTQANKTTQQTTLMLWDGNRQLQEYTDTHTFTTVYEQNSFEPIARLAWLRQDLLDAQNHAIKTAPREIWQDEPTLIPAIKVYYYHNDHLGTPNELSDDNGNVIWLADYKAWGGIEKTFYHEQCLGDISISEELIQPLRFQGQYYDVETGLHYNHFRYYDADVGMFISRDPIGLMGGNNVFQYAPNPTGWIDPFGLSKFEPVTFPDSQVIAETTINMQGSRGNDFKEANANLEFNGARGKPTQYAHKGLGDVVWHHADYDPETNTAKMQLVTTADHNAKIPHSGSVSQFEKYHNVEYESKKAKNLAKKLNGSCK